MIRTYRIYSLSTACLLVTGLAVAAEPTPDQIDRCVKLLKSDDGEQRNNALFCVEKSGWGPQLKAAAPGLQRILRTEESLEVRAMAGKVLARMGDDADGVVPVLLDIVHAHRQANADGTRPLTCAREAVTAYGDSAVPALHAALKNPKRRDAAILVLAQVDAGFEPLVPDVVELLKQGGIDESQAGKFLRRHGRTAAAQLVPLLKDDRTADRAMTVLYDFREDAVPELAHLLQDGPPAARRRAGDILYHQSNLNRTVITPATAGVVIAGMATLAGDTDVEVRRKAIVMLCRLGKPDAPEVLEALRDRDPQLRLATCDAIARRGSDVPATVHVPLTERLDDADPLIRVEAAEALLTLQPESPRLVPVLLAGLWHERGDVRYRALVAVYRMGEEGRFAGVALPCLRWFDPDRRVRRLAARMMRRMEEEGRQ
jgi:HEAT repeat protein